MDVSISPRAAALAPGIDQRPGWFANIPSALTTDVIRYFTPSPLSELFERARTVDHVHPIQPPTSVNSAFLLLHRFARRRAAATVDAQLALALGNLIRRSSRTTTFSEALLRAYASDLPGAKGRLRQEVVFSGGPVPGGARHVYPPSSSLPALLADMASALNSLDHSLYPVHRAALILYFAMAMHPFRDANGRWAHRIVLAAVPRSADAFSYSACIALHTQGVSIAEVNARGLRDYLAKTEAFERRLRDNLAFDGLHVVADSIGCVWGAVTGPRATLSTAETKFWSTGTASIEHLSKTLGLSRRGAGGVAAALVEGANGLVELRHDVIDGTALLKRIDAVFDESLLSISKERQ